MDVAAGPSARLAPVALVADPELIHGRRIGELLRQEGYRVIECDNYQHLLDLFMQEHPEVVFLAVGPSAGGGLTVIRELKIHCSTHFVPVVVVSSVADDWFLAKCIEAGCDDVLVKPVRRSMLRARLRAMEKAKGVHDEVRRRHQELRRLYSIVERNQEIAAHVFSKVVMEENQAIDDLRLFLRPAARFSGDLLLSARSPSGALYVLLGDFTGHGLAAALGAVPASQIFRAMTAKGFECKQIVQELNRKLHALLPTGMFMAASLLLTACSQTNQVTEVADSVPPTEAPTKEPTSTSTEVPTEVPTETPVPPTPTVAPPPILLDYLDGAVVTSVDSLDTRTGWELYAGSISDGYLELIGNDWNGLMKRGSIAEGEGTIINFKYEKGSVFEVYYDYGQWYTDPYRRFGIYILSGFPAANLYLGKNG
ncbi:TPA: response regulator, partial [Candidatus Micrarchaeota archaeon]|nr:response regulator [Candidatus Micrarchaeota archaeon]